MVAPLISENIYLCENGCAKLLPHSFPKIVSCAKMATHHKKTKKIVGLASYKAVCCVEDR
eukprot:TRINITY_DN1893_c0_g1_i1.p1 TRINITY_DN1893_c0_g1~~TRINITY_DN1893_c0_g1_i1.p1  ORF type:complete len:60 (-),score=3.18 TRINITY_DN1893_c0_g1_i1:32-211(-)